MIFHSDLHRPKRGNFDTENTRQKPLVTLNLCLESRLRQKHFGEFFPCSQEETSSDEFWTRTKDKIARKESVSVLRLRKLFHRSQQKFTCALQQASRKLLELSAHMKKMLIIFKARKKLVTSWNCSLNCAFFTKSYENSGNGGQGEEQGLAAVVSER
jgi:hypothetical protein